MASETQAQPRHLAHGLVWPPNDTEESVLGTDLHQGTITDLRLGFNEAEVGEVRDEFCPGDHSLRVGGFDSGMKLVGIAQRVTRRATSVGGILLVYGEEDLARVLGRVYGALALPFRAGSVGSLRRAGSAAGVEDVVRALTQEAEARYGATPASLDEGTLELARAGREEFLVRLPA